MLVLAVAILTGCTAKTEVVSETTAGETSRTEITSTIETTKSETTLTETTVLPEEEKTDYSTLDGIKNYLLNNVESEYGEYVLADLDQNGYPEVMFGFWDGSGSGFRTLEIVAYNGEEIKEDKLFISHLNEILLYRQSDDKYFYVTTEIWGDGGYSIANSKKITLDDKDNFYEQEIACCSEYYQFASDSLEYCYITDNFVDGKLVEPYGFSEYYKINDFLTDSGEIKIPYENALKDYLSQYEFVKAVDVKAIWDYDDNYGIRKQKIDSALDKFRGAEITDGIEFMEPVEPTIEYIEFNGEKYDKLSYHIGIKLVDNNVDLNLLENFPNLCSVCIYSESGVTIDISPILNNPKIKELALSGNLYVDNEKITTSKNLKMINLFGLDDITYVSKLESIDYAYIEPSYENDDINYFKPLYELPNLKWLEFNGMGTAVTTEQYKQLQENLPDCIFSWNKVG